MKKDRATEAVLGRPASELGPDAAKLAQQTEALYAALWGLPSEPVPAQTRMYGPYYAHIQRHVQSPTIPHTEARGRNAITALEKLRAELTRQLSARIDGMVEALCEHGDSSGISAQAKRKDAVR